MGRIHWSASGEVYCEFVSETYSRLVIAHALRLRNVTFEQDLEFGQVVHFAAVDCTHRVPKAVDALWHPVHAFHSRKMHYLSRFKVLLEGDVPETKMHGQ